MPNNDLIYRNDLLAAYDAAHKGPPGGARKLMEDAPAVDAAPVVRCEKCVSHNTAGVEGLGIGMCHCLGITTRDGFFCAFGLEKEAEET